MECEKPRCCRPPSPCVPAEQGPKTGGRPHAGWNGRNRGRRATVGRHRSSTQWPPVSRVAAAARLKRLESPDRPGHRGRPHGRPPDRIRRLGSPILLTTTVEMQSGSLVVSHSSPGQRPRNRLALRKKAAALWSRIQRVAVAIDAGSDFVSVRDGPVERARTGHMPMPLEPCPDRHGPLVAPRSFPRMRRPTRHVVARMLSARCRRRGPRCPRKTPRLHRHAFREGAPSCRAVLPHAAATRR